MTERHDEIDDDAVVDPNLLTQNDRQSPTWSKLRKHMEARQLSLRIRNDNPKHDEIATAMLRGELRALKTLLALGESQSAPVTDGD